MKKVKLALQSYEAGTSLLLPRAECSSRCENLLRTEVSADYDQRSSAPTSPSPLEISRPQKPCLCLFRTSRMGRMITSR